MPAIGLGSCSAGRALRRTARRRICGGERRPTSGKLECFCFALGADDVVIIIDVPDSISAAAIGLTVAASGMVQGRSTLLLTPAEIDQAAKKSPAYRPPGA